MSIWIVTPNLIGLDIQNLYPCETNDLPNKIWFLTLFEE